MKWFEAKEVSSNEYKEFITTLSQVILMYLQFYDYLLIVYWLYYNVIMLNVVFVVSTNDCEWIV